MSADVPHDPENASGINPDVDMRVPVGHFTVNVIGSFVLSGLVGASSALPRRWRRRRRSGSAVR
jgi:fluoride ion exporter CrcB/FEX